MEREKLGFGKCVERLLFPPTCICCGKLLPFDAPGGEAVLCRECRGKYEAAKLAQCPKCGRAMLDCRCVPHYLAEVGVRRVFRLAAYDPRDVRGCINSIVNRCKRRRRREGFEFLAAQLASTFVRELPPDTLVAYCPRSRRARREFGFDQAEELARGIAKATGFELCRPLTRKRTVRTKQQKQLDYLARAWNAGRSVTLNTRVRVRGRTVLLVDDVITTGATMGACASLILGAGAREVVGASLAAVVYRAAERASGSARKLNN